MSHADKNCENDLSTTWPWPLLFTLVRSQSWSLIFKKKEITYSQIINCCIASFRQQMLMTVLGEGVLPNSLHVVDDCRILGPFFFHRFFSYHPSNYYFFLTPFRHKLRWPWTSGHTIMIRYLIITMSFQILRRGNACDFTTTTFSMLSAQR